MELCDLPASEARRLIGAKSLSPVELFDSCLARIDAVNPAVNAFVALDIERGRKAAEAAEAAVMTETSLPPLHGLPIGVKDLSATRGLRTTYGSPLFRDYVPEIDEDVVARLKRGGGIILGKTNTAEWGAGANTRNAVYGATGNPFDPRLSSAGSSGGSAAALATGMAPLCTGTDVGGSLRNPAAFCGVVGYRPSLGLVGSETRRLGWSGLGVAGPMARSVGDVALMLSVMAAGHPDDPLPHAGPVADLHPPDAVDLSRLRAAFTPDLGFAPTERQIVRVFAEKIKLFRSAFGTADDAFPDCAGADDAFEVLRATEFLVSYADPVREHPGDFGPNVRANVEEGLRYSALDVGRAEATRTGLYRRWRRFFESYDVLITPTVTISPRPWSELYPAAIDGSPTRTYFHWLALAYVVTLSGHPAISLPVGLDEMGLPFGLQIVGRSGQDAALLGVAKALETVLAQDPRTARPRPDLDRLRQAEPISSMKGFMGFDAGEARHAPL